MKDYSAMSDFEINKAVAFKLGLDWSGVTEENRFFYQTADYCNNPADAWPIILEHHIAVVPYRHTLPQAWPTAFGVISKFTTEDRNPLRAAMIVYLQMMEQKS